MKVTKETKLTELPLNKWELVTNTMESWGNTLVVDATHLLIKRDNNGVSVLYMDKVDNEGEYMTTKYANRLSNTIVTDKIKNGTDLVIRDLIHSLYVYLLTVTQEIDIEQINKTLKGIKLVECKDAGV